jgi:uncharacterized protein
LKSRFEATLDPDIDLVNRENDMGLESLRQAKKALDPIAMIDKYRIKERP